MKKWISTLSFYSDRHLHSFLAWFIAGVLLLAVITKLLDPLNFYLVLINHTFIPAQFVRIAAAAIIGVEILIAILLVIPKLRPLGAPAAFLLFFGFTLFKGYHYILNTGASCGCFGILGPDTVNFTSVLINTALTFFCALLWHKHYRIYIFYPFLKSRD